MILGPCLAQLARHGWRLALAPARVASLKPPSVSRAQHAQHAQRAVAVTEETPQYRRGTWHSEARGDCQLARRGSCPAGTSHRNAAELAPGAPLCPAASRALQLSQAVL